MSKYANLTPYELAALFHEIATWRCTSQEEAFEKGDLLETVGAEMDRRDVRLEDWAVTRLQDRTAAS